MSLPFWSSAAFVDLVFGSLEERSRVSPLFLAYRETASRPIIAQDARAHEDEIINSGVRSPPQTFRGVRFAR